MVTLGYQLSSEEHPAPDLVGYARRAEEVRFSYAVIPDHFHPWTHRQGRASLVWSVLGAIAHATRRLRLGTAVTAPIRRTPPHLVAHAARPWRHSYRAALTKLRVPADFQAVADLIGQEEVCERILCGSDPDAHVAKIREFAEARFDHVHVHQVGPDQETVLRFCEREVLPRVHEL